MEPVGVSPLQSSATDSGPAALGTALEQLHHDVDVTTPVRLNRDGSVDTPGVTRDVVDLSRLSGDTTTAKLERLREEMAYNDAGRDGVAVDAKTKQPVRSAAEHDTPTTGFDMARGAALEGFDPVTVDTDPHAIKTALEARSNPIVVSGDVTGADGKARAQWVTVQSFDAKTHQFVVADPVSGSVTQWSPQRLAGFMATKHGGDAIEIAPRPAGAASQQTIDALVAAAPANERSNAKWSIPLILDECNREGITDKGQIAYILATAEHEGLLGKPLFSFTKPLEEGYGRADSRDPVGHFNAQYGGRSDLGNRALTNDGYNYRGRGFVQITGRETYATESQRLGLQKVTLAQEPAISLNVDNQIAHKEPLAALVAHPDLAARPDVAVQLLVHGMKDGWYANQKPIAHYLDGPASWTQSNFVDVRATINGDKNTVEVGASESIGNEIADRAQAYLRVLDGKK